MTDTLNEDYNHVVLETPLKLRIKEKFMNFFQSNEPAFLMNPMPMVKLADIFMENEDIHKAIELGREHFDPSLRPVFDQKRVNDFKEKLKPYAYKVEKKIPLTEQEASEAHEIAFNYWDYAARTGIKLGNLQKDVILQRGSYGKLHHENLKDVAREQGKSFTEIKAIETNINIASAYADIEFRSDDEYLPTDALAGYYNAGEYTLTAFKHEGIEPLGWVSALSEKFCGKASWVNYAGYDRAVETHAEGLVSAVKENAVKDGVSAVKGIERMAMLGAVAKEANRLIAENGTYLY